MQVDREVRHACFVTRTKSLDVVLAEAVYFRIDGRRVSRPLVWNAEDHREYRPCVTVGNSVWSSANLIAGGQTHGASIFH